MGQTLRKQVVPLLIAAASGAALAAGSAEAEAPSFVSLRVARSGDIPAEQRARAVQELATQQPDPQHVVVLVHGWDTPYYQSSKQFGQVAPQVRAEFDRLRERAAVLGVQWDSDVGPRRTWIPAAFGHYFFSLLGLRHLIRDPYTSRIPVARTLGRTGLRQVLFDVKDRFPEARIHVLAHSMGAEATAHAINPEFTPLRRDGETPIYRPERPLRLDVVALAGADLDFDSGAKSPPVNPAAAPRLLWLTLPKIGSTKDKVLSLRKRARSKAAIGNAVPGFRQDQYDTLISQRRLVFDTIDIPQNHALVDYFRNGRLSRIADAAAGIRDPARSPSVLLKHLDGVLAAPAEVGAIRPHLFGGETSPKIYALWRLEHLLCGSSAHMSNGYAETVLSRTLRNPTWLTTERGHSECKVVREGLWPPADVVEAAKQRAARRRAQAAERAAYTPVRPRSGRQ